MISLKKKMRNLRWAVVNAAIDGWELGDPSKTLSSGMTYHQDAGPFGLDLNETYDRVVNVSAATRLLVDCLTGKK